MKNIKVSELKKGDIFTESLQLKNRESFKVSTIENEDVYTIGSNSNKLKIFKTDQTKQIILLKES